MWKTYEGNRDREQELFPQTKADWALERGKSDNDDGTWWGGGRLKDRVPLYMEGKEGHRPCPVILTVLSHGIWGRDAHPLRSAETRSLCSVPEGQEQTKDK